MKKFIQRILREPVRRLAYKYSSSPDKKQVHSSLTNLFANISKNPGERGPVIEFGNEDKFIIFSDQHKGTKNGSDDFSFAEKNYMAALEYYDDQNFHFVNLGDSEELWENTAIAVRKHNAFSFEAEKKFLLRNAFTKIFGNHDLYWDNDPLAGLMLESIFGEKVKIFEGAILKTTVEGQPLSILLTHGHQGDKQSDGNWFSKWFVSTIWAPLQMYLELNLNTPSDDNTLKTVHNHYMYEWIAPQKNAILITGHTHQPVFLSLTHLERLFSKLAAAELQGDKKQIENLKAEIKLRKIKEHTQTDFSAYDPSYFNTGCCCYNDGDITGIEIAEGFIRLIKWAYADHEVSTRVILEESPLAKLSKSSASRASLHH
jgi:predicted phosphodiesterase